MYITCTSTCETKEETEAKEKLREIKSQLQMPTPSPPQENDQTRILLENDHHCLAPQENDQKPLQGEQAGSEV